MTYDNLVIFSVGLIREIFDACNWGTLIRKHEKREKLKINIVILRLWNMFPYMFVCIQLFTFI